MALSMPLMALRTAMSTSLAVRTAGSSGSRVVAGRCQQQLIQKSKLINIISFFSYYLVGDYMSKESFKDFARRNPDLASSVISGKTSWQQLFELYEIYGENNSIWNNYLKKESTSDTIYNSVNTMKDFINTFKNTDIDSLQKGINNIQKTIGLLQDLGIGSYNPTPIYKRFDN